MTASQQTSDFLYDPEQRATILQAAQRARELRAIIAKQDPNVFCQYVLRDERTGKRIEQAPMHKRWHALMNEHPRLVMWSHVEGGKTTQLAVGRVLWELGKDPTLRVLIVSNTSRLAEKMTRQVGQYIEKSDELHHVFPGLVPTKDPNLPWRAQALTIDRAILTRDPSVQACGVHGNVIGSRVDLLVLDDFLDHENTNSPGPREEVWRWVRSTLFSRLTDNARVWVVGNAWHPEDAMHRMEKEERFHAERFPVISTSGEVTWPERWPKERIELSKQDLGPLEYARQLLCQARDDTAARFKREWIDESMRRCDGMAYCESIEDLTESFVPDEDMPEEFRNCEEADIAAINEAIWRLSGKCSIITGVDLAVQKSDAADRTVLFTILCRPGGFRRVLNITAGKWTGPEIIRHIADIYRRFGSLVIVENNAAQDYIRQFLVEQYAIPVIPFTTGRNKAHPEFGVESLAAEIANGKWEIPNKGGVVHPEVHEWLQELFGYDPREHTGDRLMASWFAREGARKYWDSQVTPNVGVRFF